MYAIRLDRVSKHYTVGGHRITALDAASLDVEKGVFTTIMGPSGSGKSTLLHCSVGLDRVDSGTVTIEGTDLSALDERALTEFRRDQVGFVFQSYNLVASLTAAQNVALPSRLAGRRPARDTIVAALTEVGLADRVDHLPHELSGGEQQRLALARAALTRPAVLCADEPTGALDLARSRLVLDYLRALVDDHGQTALAVTHDPAVAARATRTVFMADGKVVDELDARRGDRVSAEDVAVRMAKLEA